MEEKLLARIRALLAKAESTEFSAEAEALTAKAVELMAAHGIEQAHLAAAGKVRDEIGQLEILVENPYARDKVELLVGIHNALRCRSVRWRATGGYRVAVVGYRSDLDRVELLYTSLLTQAVTQLVRLRAPYGESTTTYRKSWLLGFTAAVSARLQAAEARAISEADSGATSTGTSTALVLVDRKDRVQRAIDEMFSDATPAPGRRLRGSGYVDGRAAGRRADLGNGRVGGRRAAIGRG